MSTQNRSDYADGVKPNQAQNSDDSGQLESSEGAPDNEPAEQSCPRFKAGNFARRRPLAKGPTHTQIALLASQVGYLEVERFSHRHVLDAMPKELFAPNDVIPCHGFVCVIERGSVLIRHALKKYPVKELGVGGVFGEMASMGQTMSATEAAAGARGAAVTIMKTTEALEWVAAEPRWWLSILGPRLTERETLLYRREHQPIEPRVAALLMKLAGDGAVIEGITQKEMAPMIGMYRETFCAVVKTMKASGILETERRKITILDKEALRELSEL